MSPAGRLELQSDRRSPARLNEQYLLAAMLAHSRKFEIVVANYFLSRTASAGVARFALPSRGVAAGGASFWIRAVS